MSFPTDQAQSPQRRAPLLPREVQPAPPIMILPPGGLGSAPTQSRKRKRERACDLCRRKKIRCDYNRMRPDYPCSTCKGYGNICTFVEASQKRAPPKSYVEKLEGRLRRMEALLKNATITTGQPSLEQIQEFEKPDYDSDDDDKDNAGSAPASYPLPKMKASEDGPTPVSAEAIEIKKKENPAHQRFELYAQAQQDMLSSSSREDAKYSYMGSSSGIHLLSKLFQGDPSKKSRDQSDEDPNNEEDMMVPRLKDDKMPINLAFSHQSTKNWKLPPQEIVDRLIELYFMKMNIYLPIVDKTEFYESYQKGGDAVCIPLLLSLCRSACRLLDEDDWVAKKYSINRNELFVTISDEIERNFVVDFLNPNVESIQVFLVSALSARRWTPESTDWLGVSIAVKMAQDLGLHRSDKRLAMSNKRREARKRLWWSAYVMDRWICAALGRPLAISDADCDVELPNVDADDDRFSFLVHLTKLSAILGDVLRVLCSPRARNLGDRRFGVDQVRQNLERNLHDWEAGLPDHLKLSSADLDRIKEKDISLELEVRLNTGVGQLHLAYQSVFLLLKRPLISKGAEMTTFQLPNECLESTKVIMSIVEAMHVKSLLNLSWSLTSYIMTQALIVILFGLRNPDDAVVSYSKRALDGMRNHYRRLESYVPEPSIVPLLDLLERLVENDMKENMTTSSSASAGVDQVSANNLLASAVAESCPFGTSAISSTQNADGQQRTLWGTPSGLDWQELMAVLTERGYNF